MNDRLTITYSKCTFTHRKVRVIHIRVNLVSSAVPKMWEMCGKKERKG